MLLSCEYRSSRVLPNFYTASTLLSNQLRKQSGVDFLQVCIFLWNSSSHKASVKEMHAFFLLICRIWDPAKNQSAGEGSSPLISIYHCVTSNKSPVFFSSMHWTWNISHRILSLNTCCPANGVLFWSVVEPWGCGLLREEVKHWGVGVGVGTWHLVALSHVLPTLCFLIMDITVTSPIHPLFLFPCLSLQDKL